MKQVEEELPPTGDEEALEETMEPKRRRAIAAEEDSGEPTADPRAIAQVFKKKSLGLQSVSRVGPAQESGLE